MKRYLFILFIIALFLLVGCKKATITSPGDSQLQPETPDETNIENQETDVAEVPEEWKGKTVKDIANETDIFQESQDQGSSTESESSSTESSSSKNKIQLLMSDTKMLFFPKELTISVGDTVTFVNNLDYHNKTAEVTFYSYLTGIFRSPSLPYGEEFEHTFNETGNFTFNALPYQAKISRGTIVVKK